MFEELSNRFDSIFNRLKGRGKLTEENVSEAVRDVKRALLEADVNYKVVKKFSASVMEKAVGTEVLKSITPGQQFVKLVKDELTALMGGTTRAVKFHTNRMNVVVLAGLQGSGKTTACSKLALHFRKQGHRPLLVACDTYRAAAIDQLETLGKSLGIPVFSNRQEKPVQIASDALKHAKREDHSLVIIDTAGRLHIDEDMMSELKKITSLAKPDEIFFVADAMTGQDAVNVAAQFHKEISFTGTILTKMDGDARGGAALSILDVTGVPVQFVGISEKPDGLEQFHPERMASRILGMGDIVSLVEKAEINLDVEKSKKLEKKIRKNNFTLQDFLDQLRQIKKMGPLNELMAMIPGMGNQLKDVPVDDKALVKVEAIICSMTLYERQKPLVLDASRKRRIAAGSGTTVQDVNKLLKQFDTMKTMMKRMNKISGKRGQNAALRNLSPF
ncbi:signal recognition particle protein [Chitinispirillales bacterium ANBcel5]|uniref:signal recognition particle protein n=1 Tax=Cellulosispirillum alkaliphilum TaxID=3039283 RepID=UPI002A566351|nr:signal recognition particle protein [Chitinispirillales bacterium ANBcel5]